jgi:methylmalonyl-CoA mutase cobalamin-binding domain/chain
MTLVGERYQKGEYFLAELLLSAEIFKQAMETIEPYLTKVRPPEPRGKVVLATLKGDIHDLGKNIFATLLRAHGFEVHDLGVDVDPMRVVEKVKEVKPEFVGFSALITTSFDYIKMAVEMLEKEGLRKQLKVMVGGGVTTPLLKEYVGADFQTRDATEGVRYCLEIVEKGGGS